MHQTMMAKNSVRCRRIEKKPTCQKWKKCQCTCDAHSLKDSPEEKVSYFTKMSAHQCAHDVHSDALAPVNCAKSLIFMNILGM
jgi:hypothetical protein